MKKLSLRAKEAPTVTEKAPKHHCKQKSSTVSRKLPTVHSSQKKITYISVCFRNEVPAKDNIFLRELISRKLHITYSFAIQRITCKNCLGIIFLENLISATENMFFFRDMFPLELRILVRNLLWDFPDFSGFYFVHSEVPKRGHSKQLHENVIGINFSAPMGLPLPQGFWLRGTKLRPWSKQNSDSVFIGERRNSDHGLSFWEGKTQTMVWISVSQGVGGRSCLDEFRNHFWP